MITLPVFSADEAKREIASRDGWDTYFESTGLVFLRR